MTDTPRAVVVGVFEDCGQADRAVADLRRAGFRDDQIRLERPAMGGEEGAPPDGEAGGGGRIGILPAIANFFKRLSHPGAAARPGARERRTGRAVVHVEAEGSPAEALAVLQRHGGYNRETTNRAEAADKGTGRRR